MTAGKSRMWHSSTVQMYRSVLSPLGRIVRALLASALAATVSDGLRSCKAVRLIFRSYLESAVIERELGASAINFSTWITRVTGRSRRARKACDKIASVGASR